MAGTSCAVCGPKRWAVTLMCGPFNWAILLQQFMNGISLSSGKTSISAFCRVQVAPTGEVPQLSERCTGFCCAYLKPFL